MGWTGTLPSPASLGGPSDCMTFTAAISNSSNTLPQVHSVRDADCLGLRQRRRVQRRAGDPVGAGSGGFPIGVNPDGVNINRDCGSTSAETMCRAVQNIAPISA